MNKNEWKSFNQTWIKCVKCKIGELATFHVIGSGPTNADIIVIGEAPGKSEDVLGTAFIGKAGKFLREVITLAGKNPDSIYFTNLVCCRPTDYPGGANRQPKLFEVENCLPRLKEVVNHIMPKGIIFTGLASQYWKKDIVKDNLSHVKVLDVKHPAALLRRGGTKAQDYEQYIIEFKTFFEEMYK